MDSSTNEFDEKDALKFYEIIPTLQEMASYAVAIESWRRFLSSENLERESSYEYVEYLFFTNENTTKVEEQLLQFALPRSVRRMIENSIRSVEYEMEGWITYCQLWVLEEHGTLKASDLLHCHWQTDGKIDEEKTALHLLSSPRMTPLNKFQIMCKFCFEDEIKKFPIDSLPEDFIEKVNFSNNPFMFYWLCRIKNELHKLPIENGESVESLMFTAGSNSAWSAVEYFWDRLSVNERLSKISRVIFERPQFQQKLFAKMSELQKLHLLSTMPVQLMENFWNEAEQPRFAFLAWICIKNFINYEQFEQLWSNLIARPSSTFTDEKIRYLLDIWNYCPDNLKNFALQPKIRAMIVDYHSGDYRPIEKNPCDNIDFLKVYLSYADVELRKNILFERADSLVPVLDPPLIDQLVKLCLPMAEDVVKFEKYALESAIIKNDFCKRLRKDGDFARVNDFLDYFCLDSSSRGKFCCKILETITADSAAFSKNQKWIKVVKFIDENLLLILPNRALEFKKRMVSWFKDFFWVMFSNVNEMDKIIELVVQILDAEELDEFKSKVLEKIQKCYQWDKFAEDTITRSLLWSCKGDLEKIKKIKESLSIDDIFKRVWKLAKSNWVLKGRIDHVEMHKVFDPLDKCLLWYFEDAEAAKWFKLKKVFHYCCDGTSMFLSDDEESTDVFTRNTLPWFFDGRQSAIDVFKGFHRGEKISQMI